LDLLDGCYASSRRIRVSDLAGIVGAKIRELRLEKRLSREACAELAGMSSTFLGDIERGRKEPSLGTLRKISQALGAPIREIISGIETEFPEGVSQIELLLRVHPLLHERATPAEADAIYAFVKRVMDKPGRE